MRPVIGLTTSSFLPDSASSMERYGIAAVYCRAVVVAGGAPLLLPGLGDLEAVHAVFPLLDGLLLTGGPDAHPARYGQAIHPGCGRIDEARDSTELALLEQVKASRLPTFGICRGNQMLNVAFGGTLIQDISSERPTPLDHRGSDLEPSRPVHLVRPVAHTRLAALLGADPIPANSMHHQAVDRVAPGFVVNAWAEDGTVEGIESGEYPFLLAVQCHPEHLFSSESRWLRLFESFVQAAAAHAAAHRAVAV
jgi:putative glutamine amidotransferase